MMRAKSTAVNARSSVWTLKENLRRLSTQQEDGVDNSDVAQEDLYSKPEEIYEVYTELNKVAPGMFSIAAAFGNVHGVYSPGNVKLTPTILGNAQEYIIEKDQIKGGDGKPVYFVFHGGSGSSRAEIREAIGCAPL
jgi:fructose-bisphosphate aldolase class II